VTCGVPPSGGNGDSYHERVQRWAEALDEMRKALRKLDESDAAGDIGAHLDLAIARLEEEIKAAPDR
jgi:hypothetical protein